MKTRIAFIKFAGMGLGGTERWLQEMAAHLPKDRFTVDFFYCHATKIIGADWKPADTDPARVHYLRDQGVNLIEFHVEAMDPGQPNQLWVNTDFFSRFDEKKYDLVQTAKAGPREYPYFLLNLPVVEMVALNAGADASQNIKFSIHPSEYQRSRWHARGGRIEQSAVLPVPALPPACSENFRAKLNIPADAVVAGFHQRPDNNIFSTIPLEAFSKITHPDRHFVLMGGGSLYREQAAKLQLENVHFIDPTGEAESVSRFLNTLDIFAHGRRDGETFGAVLAEAMMHGKPCLSHLSPAGDNAQPETMGPGGLFAEDSTHYETLLAELFEKPRLRRDLGAKGLAHALTHYEPRVLAGKLEAIYDRVLGRQRGPFTLGSFSHFYTDMGFLLAGDFKADSAANYAKALESGREPYEAHLAALVFPHIESFLDIGAGSGVLSYVAAKRCPAETRLHALEDRPHENEVLAKTLYLNGWEERVSCRPVCLEGFETEGVDFVAIDGTLLGQPGVSGLLTLLEHQRPALLVRAPSASNEADRDEFLAGLAARGYRIWRDDKNHRLQALDASKDTGFAPRVYFCLPGDKTARWQEDLFKMAHHYPRPAPATRKLKPLSRILRAFGKLLKR